MKLSKRNRIAFIVTVATLSGLMLMPVSPAFSAEQAAEEESSSSSHQESLTRSDDLQAILDSTRVQDLKPLASGFQAGDGGTAPYDGVTPQAEDLALLDKARKTAQQILDTPSSSQIDREKAGRDLQNAFQKVRFIYHYTGITGTNGARIFDTKGDLIQAHGAGIQRVKISLLPDADQGLDANGDGYIYILCGEDKTDRLIARGVRIYYSDDLYNWVDKGLGFQTYRGDADLTAKLAGTDPTYHQYYTVENLRSDPDYTNIYGKDFGTFARDRSNANISSPEEALNYLLWDLKALKGDGSDPSKSSCVFERPKMAYNPATGRWVIWFHADGPVFDNENTDTYSKAKAGVAISEGSDPAGPYKYLGSFRMSPGTNSGNPGMARDMNLYVDSGKDLNQDGVDDAYLIYASNENRDLTISLLDRTYTKLVTPTGQQKLGVNVAAGDTYNIAASNSKESPAPFKWNGRYYIIYSGTTGWAPNENKYAVSQSDNILGPYQEIGTPFIKGNQANQSPSNSFVTQSSTVVPYDPDHGVFLYWGDRWFNPDKGNDISQSRYVMTPMQIINGQVRVLPASDWKLEGMEGYRAIDIDTKLAGESTSVSRLIETLPETVSVRVGGETVSEQTKVEWDPYFGPDQPYGQVALTGKLPNFRDLSISFNASIYPEDARLFIDAGSDPNHESEYYQQLKKKSVGLINTTNSDQVYAPGKVWGLTSRKSSDVEAYETGQTGIYETGYWAKKDKDIRYQADLPAGSYTVQAGYKEWWSNSRQTVFSVTSEGKTLGETEVVPSQTGNATDLVTFSLDHAASVTFLTRSIGGGDPVLSWIGVSALGGDQVSAIPAVKGTIAFVQGSQPKLPTKVSVRRVNGVSEERPVHWLLNTSDLTLYSPTKIQGTVQGTTLPATATVQMVESGLSYFIDINGSSESPTYKAVDSLTPGGLANRKADQLFDSRWGNASSQYGTHSGGDSDPYESGIFAGADGTKRPLLYGIFLAPGEHQVSFGFKDWWSQSRPTTISYRYVGVSEKQADFDQLLETTVDGRKTIATGTVTVPQGWNKPVIFSLESDVGTGPILSWISVKGAKPLGPVQVQPAPIIKGIDDVTINQGETFDPMAGVSAHDSIDGDLTGTIQVQGLVDTTSPGTYQLTYSVANTRGARVSRQRRVRVIREVHQPGGAGGAKANSGNSSAGNYDSLVSTGADVSQILLLGMACLLVGGLIVGMTNKDRKGSRLN